jgi:hypothetical protein
MTQLNYKPRILNIYTQIQKINSDQQVTLSVLTMRSAPLDAALCTLLETDRDFRRSYCLHRQGDDNSAREENNSDIGAGPTKPVPCPNCSNT